MRGRNAPPVQGHVCIRRTSSITTAPLTRTPSAGPFPVDVIAVPDPRHRALGGRRLRRPIDGALGRFAAAADRRRFRRDGRRRLDHRLGLQPDARLDAAGHRPDRRGSAEIRHHVRALRPHGRGVRAGRQPPR